jgi:hypothetical protein
MIHFEKEGNGNKRDSTEWEIYPENPSPGDVLCKCSSNDRSGDAPERPHQADQSKPFSTVSESDHVGYYDIREGTKSISNERHKMML